jgi:hypothetical protein
MKQLSDLKRLESFDSILVALVWQGIHRWFCSAKEDWVLNQTSWGRIFGEEDDTCSHRYEICILSVNTIEEFLIWHSEYEISQETIKGWFLSFMPLTSWQENWHLFPSLLLDFDNRELLCMFPEPFFIERYLPDHWKGEWKTVPTEIPEHLRYWIVDDVDWWKYLMP